MIEKISLNSLRFFYYVAEHNSVTLASQKLFVTQSAVSKQIKNLEDALGIPLFNRVNKKLVLTANGNLFQLNIIYGTAVLLNITLKKVYRRTKKRGDRSPLFLVHISHTARTTWRHHGHSCAFVLWLLSNHAVGREH